MTACYGAVFFYRIIRIHEVLEEMIMFSEILSENTVFLEVFCEVLSGVFGTIQYHYLMNEGTSFILVYDN